MKIKACPNCGSTEIEYASMVKESGTIAGLGLPEVYYCKECGYKGSVILETTQKGLKKIKFKKIKLEEPVLKIKEGAEIIKPIFTISILLFFAATVFLLMPQAERIAPTRFFAFNETNITLLIEGENVTLIQGLAVTIPPTVQRRTMIQTLPLKQVTLVALTAENATAVIESASGIGAVIGFIFPLFMVFFALGLIVLLVYSHWHRMLRFRLS